MHHRHQAICRMVLRLSSLQNGVDSHSSLAAEPQKSKNPPKRVFT